MRNTTDWNLLLDETNKTHQVCKDSDRLSKTFFIFSKDLHFLERKSHLKFTSQLMEGTRNPCSPSITIRLLFWLLPTWLAPVSSKDMCDHMRQAWLDTAGMLHWRLVCLDLVHTGATMVHQWPTLATSRLLNQPSFSCLLLLCKFLYLDWRRTGWPGKRKHSF